MKQLIAKPAVALLSQLGYKVTRQSPTKASEIMPLAHPTDAIYQQTNVTFEVPLSKCYYPYYFSYALDGWHPFVLTLLQYKKNPDIQYSDTVLHDYYQKFQPKNLLEFYFETDPPTGHVAQTLERLTLPPHEPFMPWDPSIPLLSGEKGLESHHGSQGYGPVTDEKGQLEFERLVKTYESIKAHGFIPDYGHDGDIKGYFLINNDNDYRFIIRAGLHRVAALSVLEFSNIRVKFKPNFPRVIYLANVARWPLVKANEIDVATAERIFLRYFRDSGFERAKHLSLT